MPVYEYNCPHCGPFADLRPMSLSGEPHDCPDCGTRSPRVILSAPRLAVMPAATRNAHAVNERSAHEPRSVQKHVCGPGCGHSHSSSPGKGAAPAAMKTFPKKRPWMVSH
ncbi:zinc ribbon domain-containing protein [Telmatospirillum sp. J64-1]|uniref:FmdB family zinc ribbon protein n=1 Tax=Telmatospirillum sp. J64-1 TaxID=2502183 RepID=UPI00115E1714|nr:zinc ribbon domain-containing protein [Telmatospirillum sp. J64-1]